MTKTQIAIDILGVLNKLGMFSDRLKLQLAYLIVFNTLPNLKNPARYTEKIQWYKLHGNLEKYYTYTDKLIVRDFIQKSIGDEYLQPLLGVWDRAEDIDFGSLPNQFVLKTTHGSGYNIVCRNKCKLDISLAKKKLKRWLSINYGKKRIEKQYLKCTRKIICEEYLEDVEGGLLDYKFFCFMGNPKFVQVDFDRSTNHKRAFYDINWKKLNFTSLYPIASRNLERPKNFTKMINISRLLSKNFQHVRVDLYNINGRIIFGELTFAHEGGFGPFFPDFWDYKVGKLLPLKYCS